MNKTAIAAVLGILGGAGIGAGVTYILFKKRFDADLDEAVNEVKTFYAYRNQINKEPTEDPEESSNDRAAESYPNPVEQDSIFDFDMDSHATNYSTTSDFPDEPKELKTNDDIYVIDEDTYYGAIADGADPTEYMYYADHILADENSDVIDNIESLVGREALTYFGNEGVDSVYVHNKRLNMYIEILRSERQYKEDYAYKL